MSELIDLLIEKKLFVATAESCTGGMIAARLTDMAGSSAYVDRGFVTYSNEAKNEMLGVAMGDIQTHGAVSSIVAEAMATGALKHSKADIAVAVTGIAGPGGGSEEKPVGLVWFGLAYRDNVLSEKQIFKGDRAEVRAHTVEHAFQLLEKAALDI